MAALLLAGVAARGDLVLRYSFDEASGPALDGGKTPAADGTLVGAAARLPNGSDQALNLNFAGATNYVSGGNPGKLNGLTNITLVTWLNLQAAPAVSDRLLDKLASAAGFSWKINTPNAGTVSAANFSLALHINSTTTVSTSGADTGADHQWVFMAVTYDGTASSGNVKFYTGTTNGAVTQLGSALSRNAGKIADTSNDFRVGCVDYTTSDRTPPALFDEVRVYNTVLSAVELEDVRAATTPTGVYTGVPVIMTQPKNVTAQAGTNVTFSVDAIGGGLQYQWQVNGVSLPGATGAAYTITNVLPDFEGAYSVVVSNTSGTTNSVAALLTVIVTNMFNTAVMTNIWNLLPDDRVYLTASNTTARGLAYDVTSGAVILASRSGGNAVVSLDPATGAELSFLDTTSVIGGLYPINCLGVADDGAVYVANLTTSATNAAYTVYRWATNSPSVAPSVAFSGDPAAPAFPALRWGDNFTVRGAGKATQILISPGNVGAVGTNIVVLLRTADGVDFQTTVPPAVIQITNAAPGFGNLGLAFGPGTNTFFAKAQGFP
ncbi:MAG: LamG-like jellyroll fold domain-containing protein, partial [Verrucomicrobiota bacterium]